MLNSKKKSQLLKCISAKSFRYFFKALELIAWLLHSNLAENVIFWVASTWTLLTRHCTYISWPSKPDSAPVRGDGYEPGSSKFRLGANAETSHSVRVGAGGC